PAYTAGGEPTRVFYAQSWALTHMLVLSDRYGPRYRDFTRLLLAGASAAEAFQGAFGKPISRVESELGGYLRGEWFKVVYFDTKLQKESESPEVRQASPAEAGLVLARLYREADTQELMLAKLAEENPQSWEVAEAQGYFEWQRKRNPEAALAHFERAAQLGAGSARMYYDYALLLGRERGQEEKRIALLRKALELQPDFQEPKLALGVALYNQRLYAQAVAALNGVRQVNRDEALSMFRILAHSYHQLGQPEDARKAAERLREISRTPREVEDAEELLRYVSRSPGSEELEAAASISGDGPADEPAPARPAPAGERPRLERRSASANPPAEPPAPAARPRMRMEGTLFQFDCLGDAARLTVLHSGRRVSFAILDPADVRIRGAESATLDFSCGRQQPLAVVIEFEEKVDGRLGTTGVVKAIEFQ
ncbi:MAG TPA: hypothetical protein VNN17_10005, partial [Terriglobia bacterium]|nr:hypothetical protein [Terriglobia bacterium]